MCHELIGVLTELGVFDEGCDELSQTITRSEKIITAHSLDDIETELEDGVLCQHEIRSFVIQAKAEPLVEAQQHQVFINLLGAPCHLVQVRDHVFTHVHQLLLVVATLPLIDHDQLVVNHFHKTSEYFQHQVDVFVDQLELLDHYLCIPLAVHREDAQTQNQIVQLSVHRQHADQSSSKLFQVFTFDFIKIKLQFVF